MEKDLSIDNGEYVALQLQSTIKRRVDLMTFGAVRKWALSNWLQQTNRKRSYDDLNDDTTESYECKWQNEFVTNGHLPFEDNNRYHNSIFCSMSDWNTHITDWLCDDRFDKLFYWYDDDKAKSDETRDALFRHYTIFFLIVSEVMTDLIDLTKIIAGQEHTQNLLSLNTNASKTDVGELMRYINSIHKHKIGERKKQKDGDTFIKLHLFNHHRPYVFLDNNESPLESWGDGYIKVMDLPGVLYTVHCAFIKVHNLLKDNYEKLKEFEVKADQLSF